MTEYGFFAVDRDVWTHPALAARDPFTRREAYLWLVSEAAWRPTVIGIGGRRIALRRGQLVHSVRFIAEKWRWSKSAVARFLATLQADTLIGTATDGGITVITIRNYDHSPRGAASETRESGTAHGTPAGQARDREEEINTSNTPEADASGELRAARDVRAARAPRATRLPVDWSPSSEDIAFAGTLIDAARIPFEADTFRDHWRAANGPPAVKRDWSAAWRNWVRRATDMRRRKELRNGESQHAIHRSAGFAHNRAARIAGQLGLGYPDQ
jgi:hypothetical protein